MTTPRRDRTERKMDEALKRLGADVPISASNHGGGRKIKKVMRRCGGNIRCLGVIDEDAFNERMS